MGRFVMECPNCGKFVEVRTGLFHSQRAIPCDCGYVIDVKTDRMISRRCPHCGNIVLFDQRKGDKARCPVCHELINTKEETMRTVVCPSCSCTVTVSPSDIRSGWCQCPVCSTKIDLERERIRKAEREKGIASVVKYEGSNDTLVFKHPIEDFNLGSQLIVHASQEALFFRDGRALDLFGEGRYSLSTQNIPLLSKMTALPFNADTIFHSEIYFINQAVHREIKWGTDSKVRLFDPGSGLHLEIGASGTFSLKVTDSRRLVLQLVGTENGLKADSVLGKSVSQSGGSGYSTGLFRGLILGKIKSGLAKSILDLHIDILQVDAYMDELSDQLKQKINPYLETYGLTMPEFTIAAISLPDEDPDFQRLREQFAQKTLGVREEQILEAQARAAQTRKTVEAQTAAQMKLIQAQAEAQQKILMSQAKAEEMKLQGYSYQDETARQVSMEALKNGLGMNGPISGSLGDIAGLGVSLGTIGGIMNMTQQAITPLMQGIAGSVPGQAKQSSEKTSGPLTWTCPGCGRAGLTSLFCPDCGTRKPEN